MVGFNPVQSDKNLVFILLSSGYQIRSVGKIRNITLKRCFFYTHIPLVVLDGFIDNEISDISIDQTIGVGEETIIFGLLKDKSSHGQSSSGSYNMEFGYVSLKDVQIRRSIFKDETSFLTVKETEFGKIEISNLDIR